MKKRPKLFAAHEANIATHAKWAAGAVKIWSLGGEHRKVINVALERKNVKIKVNEKLKYGRVGEFVGYHPERPVHLRSSVIKIDKVSNRWGHYISVASTLGHESFHAMEFLVEGEDNPSESKADAYQKRLDIALGVNKPGTKYYNPYWDE